MPTIVIAEDEGRIASFVQKGLEKQGFATVIASDGDTAYRLGISGSFDLMILDVGLPRMDGFSVLRRLRSERVAMPIIMLTARSDPADTVAGLDGGADDYVHKPFSFDELLARVRLRLRDTGRPEETVLCVGDLSLDLRTRRVHVDGMDVELTTREFTLADMFFRHPDQVLTREQLLSAVWGFDFDPGSNVVDVYVRYLRRKLGDGRIQTVRGAGYRLVP